MINVYQMAPYMDESCELFSGDFFNCIISFIPFLSSMYYFVISHSSQALNASDDADSL